jgi:hypothetical protein
MRVEIIKGFLSAEECFTLNSWVVEGVSKGWLSAGFNKGSLQTQRRLTSRMYGERFQNPQIVVDTSNRIREFCGVEAAPLIDGHGKDGVVVSCTFSSGDVYAHKDPRGLKNMATLRCNVMTQKPTSGGVLFVGGQCIELEVGDLHCYLASEHEHYVTEVGGDTPRILWMFGAHVPAEDWNCGRIKLGEEIGIS